MEKEVILLALWQIWLIAATVLAAVEIISTTFFMLWFAIGAVVASITALMGATLVVQSSIFLLVSLLLVLFTRPLVEKFIKAKNNEVQTNVDGLAGRTGFCLESIPAEFGGGLVKLGGEIWSAVSIDGKEIMKGEQVKVIRVEGVTLFVEKLGE